MILLQGAEIKREFFSAGELKIKLPVIAEDVPVRITWRYEDDGEYFMVACMRMHYLQHECHLYIPYFPHARMDRVKNPEDVFTLKHFAELINALGFKSVTTEDVHSNVTTALVNNIHNLSPYRHIKDTIMSIGDADLVLFFPDEGAAKRYGEMFPKFYQTFGLKKRNWETQKIEGLTIIDPEMVKDKNVLIVDDICSYGNTFVRAAKALREAGAKKVHLYVTHAEEAIAKGEVFEYLDEVYTTSSLVRTPATEAMLFHVS